MYRRRIIDVFVNSVYIFGDKIVFTYNFKDGTDTFSLKDVTLAIHAKSSDVADSASPKIPNAPAFGIFTYYLFTIHSSLICAFGIFGK